MLIHHKFASFSRLLKIANQRPPLFCLTLLKNFASYFFHKFFLRRRYVNKKIHDFYLRLDLHDPGISRSLLLVGDREGEHRFLLEHIVKPNFTILDIGANVGYYVLLENKLLHGSGHIVALEPHPTNYALLRQNIKLNKINQLVTTINAAICNNDGKTSLFLSRLSNVHSLSPQNSDQLTGQKLTVPALSLPTIVNTFPEIDIIRMDIEGYEYNVLRSLLTINKSLSFCPHILLELHPPKYDKQKFLVLLRDLYKSGYFAKFVACSLLDPLQENNLKIIKSIPTDGFVRHIVQNVSLTTLSKIVFRSRALLLCHSDP